MKKKGKAEESHGLDGKVNLKEFIVHMFEAGISWLSQKEMKERFEAMDDDKSGKLNLLEVQDEATRVLEIVRKARLFAEQVNEEAKHRQAEGGAESEHHKGVKPTEILDAYCKKLLADKELLASPPPCSCSKTRRTL